MFSLTIHFGPSNMVWAFLYKDEEKAEAARVHAVENGVLQSPDNFAIEDDFGQIASFSAGAVHGICFEDLDQVEAARIQRSLAEERCKVKLMTAAKQDPVISQAMRGQTPVLTPQGGFR